jgi:hypothetical protein
VEIVYVVTTRRGDRTWEHHEVIFKAWWRGYRKDLGIKGEELERFKVMIVRRR